MVLDREDLFAEIICDKIHVNPSAVRLFWKAKGPQRSSLITDATSATGMPNGNYRLGSFEITLVDGTCLLNGGLAGSALTLDRALENLMHFAGVTLPEALPLVTQNPARMLGMQQARETLHAGLAVGSRADLVALDTSGRLVASFSAGRLA